MEETADQLRAKLAVKEHYASFDEYVDQLIELSKVIAEHGSVKQKEEMKEMLQTIKNLNSDFMEECRRNPRLTPDILFQQRWEEAKKARIS